MKWKLIDTLSELKKHGVNALELLRTLYLKIRGTDCN